VREIVEAVRTSGGEIVAVDDMEIVDALGALARRGIYVEPTSAAAAAGLRRLFADGTITRDQTTVLLLTGSGLKASEKIGELLGVSARREETAGTAGV
jgi:threonine synthase